MFKSLAPFAILLAGIAGCNNETKSSAAEKDSISTNNQEKVTSTPPVAVKDEQGCDTTVGQQWSQIRKACVFVVDLSFMNPKDPSLDQGKPAHFFIEDERVEIFLPTQKKSVVLRRSSPKNEAPEWSSGPLKLGMADGKYTLYDGGKILYQGMPVR